MIRDFTTNDTDSIVTIWHAATQLAHPFLNADFVMQEAENLRNVYLVHAKTRVLEIEGCPRGFIAMIGNEIGGLFLDPDYHGQGHGRALVDDAVALHGELIVEVFAKNQIGRRFYDGYGFRSFDTFEHEATSEQVLRLRRARISDPNQKIEEAVA